MKNQHIPWNVLYTYNKSEKTVYNQLVEWDVEAFLPLYPKIRKWRKRKIKSIVPLFPSYVFAKVPPVLRYQTCNLKGVVNILSIEGKACKVPEADIDRIKVLIGLKEDKSLVRENYFKKGQRVIISQGTFKGMQGELLEERGNQRFLIKINSIKEAFSIEVNSRILEIA